MTHRDALAVRLPSVPLSACEGTLTEIGSVADGDTYHRCAACGAAVVVDPTGLAVRASGPDPDALVRALARHFEVRGD